MDIQVPLPTVKCLQYEVLAVFEYEGGRYWGSRNFWWRCTICGHRISVDRITDVQKTINHLYNIHDITPVQTGFTWIGRPKEGG